MHTTLIRTFVLASVTALIPRLAAAEDCSLTGTGTLGAALVEHSCFHAEQGPFADVMATPGTVPDTTTSNIDPVHTYYRVSVVADQPNVVTYAPLRTGTWAIFGDTSVPLRVLDAEGDELPILLAHDVPDCSALPRVRVYSLEALARYTVVLGPAPVTTTAVVVEKIGDFEELHGKDADGDGYGTELDSLSTPCVPPAGYVNDVSDCDDSDAAIHPAAEEVCDGRDQNCNGVADDNACEVGGGGGCAATSADTGPAWLYLLVPFLVGWLARPRRMRRMLRIQR
jgi:hypothetical protein